MQNIAMKRPALCSKLTRQLVAYTFALLPVLMASCGSRDNKNTQWIDKCSVVADRVVAGGDTMIVCDYSAVKESVRIPFSMWVDSLEVIKLDNNTEEALVGDTRIVDVSDNYIQRISAAKYPIMPMWISATITSPIFGDPTPTPQPCTCSQVRW